MNKANYDYKDTLKEYKRRLRYYNNKDENGRFCLFCGEYLSGRRWLYCSDECGDSFFFAWCERYDWNTIRKRILRRDKYICQKCKKNKAIEVHHIIARYDGGTNEDTNLISLCKKCHNGETAKIMKRVGESIRLENEKIKIREFNRLHKKLETYFEI